MESLSMMLKIDFRDGALYNVLRERCRHCFLSYWHLRLL